VGGTTGLRSAAGFIGHGLRRILEELNYPLPDFPFEEIEKKLLAASNRIRFDDDLTFLDVQIREIHSAAI
jgi:hypothetical protein